MSKGDELLNDMMSHPDVGAVVRELLRLTPASLHQQTDNLMRLCLLVGYGRGMADATERAAATILVQLPPGSALDAVTVDRKQTAPGGGAGLPSGDGHPDV